MKTKVKPLKAMMELMEGVGYCGEMSIVPDGDRDMLRFEAVDSAHVVCCQILTPAEGEFRNTLGNFYPLLDFLRRFKRDYAVNFSWVSKRDPSATVSVYREKFSFKLNPDETCRIKKYPVIDLPVQIFTDANRLMRVLESVGAVDDHFTLSSKYGGEISVKNSGIEYSAQFPESDRKDISASYSVSFLKDIIKSIKRAGDALGLKTPPVVLSYNDHYPIEIMTDMNSVKAIFLMAHRSG